MTKPQIITGWIFFTLLAIAIVWDIYATVNNIEGDTFTQVCRKVSHDHPIIPFAFGVVAGHLWWHS